MKTGAQAIMPLSVRRTLKKLGEDINIARRKRRLSVADVTGAAGISSATLRRLEKGDPSVSLAALAMVMMTLGEHRRIEALLDVSKDTSGLLLDIARLPKRIVKSHRPAGGVEL